MKTTTYIAGLIGIGTMCNAASIAIPAGVTNPIAPGMTLFAEQVSGTNLANVVFTHGAGVSRDTRRVIAAHADVSISSDVVTINFRDIVLIDETDGHIQTVKAQLLPVRIPLDEIKAEFKE